MAQNASQSSRGLLLPLLAVALAILFALLGAVQLRVARQESLLDYLSYLGSTQEELATIEFGFLFEKEASYIQRLEGLRQTYESLSSTRFRRQREGIAEDAADGDGTSSLVEAIQEALDDYFAEVSRIFVLQTELGLNHESGHYGALREHAHAVEEQLQAISDNAGLVLLLQLRRHEKDFMLRGQDLYFERFKETKEAMLRSTEVRLGGQAELLLVTALIDDYEREFSGFVAIANEIGYGEAPGATQRTATYRAQHQSLSLTARNELLERLAPLHLGQRVIVTVLILTLAATGLAVLRVRREIEHARERSPLTDLNGNRRIQMHLSRISGLSTNRVVIYFDFDFFKPFNDHFGFQVGDDVIRGFADLLRTQFGRSRHFIGHVGGDDFVVAMSDITFEDAMEQAEVVRERFREFSEKFYDDEDIARGWAPRKDRFGEIRELPLLSVSMAMVELPPHLTLNKPDEISAGVSLIKGLAKSGGFAAISLLSWQA